MRQFFPRLSDLSDLSDPSDKVRGSFLFPHEAEPGLNGFIFIRARGPARIPGTSTRNLHEVCTMTGLYDALVSGGCGALA
ncbi:MAG: hypothetical protein J5858_08370, partial [Lentisphaeria bacterium]|nr:hypothetical protein [Lentisphaeria bacterium]